MNESMPEASKAEACESKIFGHCLESAWPFPLSCSLYLTGGQLSRFAGSHQPAVALNWGNPANHPGPLNRYSRRK